MIERIANVLSAIALVALWKARRYKALALRVPEPAEDFEPQRPRG